MRIVLDCRSVFPGMGGIGRSTACLARELPAALGPEHELVLLLGARRPAEPLAHGPNVRALPSEAAMIDPAFEQLRLPALLRELEADVYHGTCFAVPLAASAVARVATVHDVVFRRRPELVAGSLGEYLARWTEVSCLIADAVVTVSEFSRGEIAALYGRPAGAIDVVPCAVEPRFFALPRRPATAPFLLYVGALEAKKNVEPLLDGFAALLTRRPDLPHRLVLAGGQGGQPFDLARALAGRPEVAPRVDALGHVPEARLLELYASAAAFCYLSEYEGFGLPPLEAMAAGLPTLVSDRTSLPEVTAGGALVVDPADPAAVADALEQLLCDEALRAELATRGRAAAGRFRWSESARALATVYRAAHARARGRCTPGAAA